MDLFVAFGFSAREWKCLRWKIILCSIRICKDSKVINKTPFHCEISDAFSYYNGLFTSWSNLWISGTAFSFTTFEIMVARLLTWKKKQSCWNVQANKFIFCIMVIWFPCVFRWLKECRFSLTLHRIAMVLFVWLFALKKCHIEKILQVKNELNFRFMK